MSSKIKLTYGSEYTNRKAIQSAQKNAGYIKPENRVYEVQLDNGQTVGNITWWGKKAIESDDIDTYKPRNEKERTSIEKYKSYRDRAREKAKKQNNPIYERYNIDPDTFDEDDLRKWAEEHNFNYYPLSDGPSQFYPKFEGGFLGTNIGAKKLTTKQEEEDLVTLENLITEKRNKKYAEKAPILTSIASYPLNLIGGITGVVETADSIYESVTGREGLPDYTGLSAAASTIRETVTDKYASKWFGGAEGKFGNYGSLLYNGLMSMGDSALSAYTGFGAAKLLGRAGVIGTSAKDIAKTASKITSALMSSSATASAISQNKKRGLSDAKATALGVASGLAEYITEKYSLDAIFKAPKNIISGALKSFVAEGSEEMGSNVINYIADLMIGQDDSELKQTYKNYISSGMTENKAMLKTLEDCIYETLSAGIVGGLSGVAMSGVYHGTGSVSKVNEAGNNIKKAKAVDSVVSVGLEYDKNSKIYKSAQKINEARSTNKDISDFQIGKLYNSIANDIQKNYQNNSKEIIQSYDGFSPTHYNTKADEHVSIIQTEEGFYAAKNSSGQIVEITKNELNKNYEQLTQEELNEYILNTSVNNELNRRINSAYTSNAYKSGNNNESKQVLNGVPGLSRPTTAYKNKAVQQTENVQAPSWNVRNASAYAFDGSTVSQNDRVVNSKDMQNNDNYASVLNRNIAGKFASAAGVKPSSAFSAAFLGTTEKMSSSETGVADRSVVQNWAQSYVNALKEAGSAGYTAVAAKTDNLAGAILEHSLGIGSGFTQNLKNDPSFLKMSQSFSNAVESALKSNIRYRQQLGFNSVSAQEQLSAMLNGDFSSVGGGIAGDFVTGISESEKITLDMSDDARAELLNKKSVDVVSVDTGNTKTLDNIDLEALQNSYPSYARPIIKKIARDFGILNEPFFNPDIELEFSYSGDSIQESINKQHSRYGDFVKMLSVFSDVIENAVGVETHKDKYTGTRREDTNLKQMYVLASAFSDEKGIYPVKLEVKEFKKNTNKLYLSVVLTKKESRYLSGNLGQNQLNTAPPTSTISIADLVGIVNPSEGDFLKYFPDSMLDTEQIEGKREALAKDAERVKNLKAPLKNHPEGDIIKTDSGVSLPEAFKRDENGKIRFNQVDIDYTNKQYREENFNTLMQGSVDTENLKGGIIGKYGIHKKNNGYFGVNLLSSGMDIAAIESFDDALKFATYTNENVSFNDVSYTKNAEGRLTIEATPEFMQYGEQIKAIKSERAYLQTEIAVDESVTEPTENVIKKEQTKKVNRTDFGYELEGLPEDSIIDEIAKEAADGGVITLKGNNNLEEAILIYDEGVSEEQIKADITGYYQGNIMPEIAYSNDLPWEDVKFSIENIVGDKQSYGKGVYLDTDIFDDVKPRNWNKILAEFVYNNLAGKSIEIFNSDGTAETINFAKTNERVKKDDANNSHKVIDKLARTKGNINSLAIVHIDELLQTSKEFDETKDNSHQWLDENGWKYRTAYLIDRKGQIYETTLNIAKARDGRNILYALSNTKKVDDGVVFSTSKEEELAHNVQLSLQTISQNDKVVNSSVRKKSKNDTKLPQSPIGDSSLSEGALDSESEVNRNENRRNSLLSGNVEGRVGESAGEQSGRISERPGASEEDGRRRQRNSRTQEFHTEDVRANGGTEVKRRGFLQCEFVKEDYYTDEMNAIATENAKKGITTHFLVGNGKHILKKGLSFRGAVRGNEIFIQCDNARYSPTQINKHELVHHGYNTEAIQKIRKYIKSELTEEERQRIYDVLYANYRTSTKGDIEAIFEEFVCDVLAGMNDYAVRFENVANEYWNGADADIDIYSPAEYTESIDAGGAGKYSVNVSNEDVKAVQSIGRKSVNDFTSEDIKKTERFARRYFKEMGVKSPFFRAWFGDWRANDITPVHVVTEKGSIRGITKNKDTGWDIQVSGKVFNETTKQQNTPANIAYHHLDNLNGIVENAVLLDSISFEENKKSPNSFMMHSLYALSDSGQGIELIKLYVDEMYTPNSNDTIKRAYKLNGYSKIQLKAGSGLGVKAYSTLNSTGNTYTVSDLFAVVKQNDKNFNPKPASMVVNDDGTPKVVYHGTSKENGEFYIFDLSKNKNIVFGNGHYFSENLKSTRKLYASSDGRIVEAYLDIKKPFVISQAEFASIEDIVDVIGEKLGASVTRESLQSELIRRGYDGVYYKTENGNDIWVAFRPEQIKSATDNIGTFDNENDDTRYSFSENEGGTDYLTEPIEQIKDDIKEVRLRAEAREGKVYTTSDVRQVCSSILENIDTGTGKGLSMSTGNKAAMMVLANRVLNSTESEKAKHIKRLSAFIAQKATVYDTSDDYDYAGDLRELRSYLTHSVELTAEDKAVLDGMGVSGYKSLFGGGNVGIDVIYSELSERRPDLFPDNIYATDAKLERIVEMYEFFKNGAADSSARLIDVLKADDRKIFADAVEGQISRAFSDEELGRESKLTSAVKADVERLEEKHRKEIEQLRERYEKKIASMKKAAQTKNKKSLAEKGLKPKEKVRFESFKDATEKFGRIKQGENPVRDVEVPKRIDEKRYVSRFARTMLEAGITPDDSVSEFEKAILDGTMTHEVITNKKAGNWAKQQIKYLGFEEALNRWTVLSETGKIGKNELALGMELYNQCITNKDVHNAMKIAAELVSEATRAGQTLQACRMLKLMTPDGQLYYLEKSIQKMNEEFRDKLGDKYKDIELDEKLMEEYLSEKDEERRNIVYDNLCQNIADQIPATMLDKWNSWRYLAMLGNPRTHIRNIVGNAIFIPAVRAKNYVGAVIEKTTKVSYTERTKSMRKSKNAVEFAKKDFDAMAKALQGENAKYAVTSDIEGKRTIFKTKWLEKLRLKNFDFLEKEDMLFLKMHYVDALARLITVRNIDTRSVTPETLATLRAYAVKEAQAATYRDANALAEGLNKLQRKLEHSDKKAVRATSVLLEGVMPFKKTPMNIAKQGINYSPIGILKGTYKMFKKLKDGNVTADDVIDDFAKGLTGTGVMLLGLWLASLGMLIGAGDKPQKEKEFDKMVGEQSYAFKVKDAFSYTIDWMTPSNLSLFIGAKLYDLTKDDFSFADIVDALSTVTEPLLELSVFSGVNGVIESAQYSDSEALLAIGSDMITSYMLQALPTIGGQLSRIIDENKREYYFVDKNSDVPKGLQRFIGQASSKIPFASYLFEPAIDEWGREEKYGNVLERAFENTVSPGYYAEDNYTEVDKELRELYERTGESSVLPVIQQKYYKQDKIYYYMSAKDYTQVKKMRGKRSFELISNLLDNKIVLKNQEKKFSSMTDEEKVNAVKKCYEQAGKETKEKMLKKVKKKAM